MLLINENKPFCNPKPLIPDINTDAKFEENPSKY